MIPSIIATLATGRAMQDLRIFLKSLEIFNPSPPTVYIYCDTVVTTVNDFNYPGKLVFKPVLDEYTLYTRQKMEKMPGKHFKNLWFDFMAEKINLIQWVFEEESAAKEAGVMFCDADICFTGPLPEIPDKTLLALSPHAICTADAKKYGYYNGGYLWMREARLATQWWDSCAGARFYEQSALEDLATAVKHEELYEFPVTENYGWWRLWQGVRTPSELVREWTTDKKAGGSGITVNGARLGSVHTHFHEKGDMATRLFNEFVVKHLTGLAQTHEPAHKLLEALK
jgi:hypothetical protein